MRNIVEKTLGSRVAELRRAQGITQEDLGITLGVSKATINRYENGIIDNLPRTRIEQLAKALHTSPGYLLGWEMQVDDTYMDHKGNGHISEKALADQDERSEKVQEYIKAKLENETQPMSKEETEILRIYKALSVRDRIKLLQFAYDLEEGK